MKCPYCDYKISSWDERCPNCGAPLGHDQKDYKPAEVSMQEEEKFKVGPEEHVEAPIQATSEEEREKIIQEKKEIEKKKLGFGPDFKLNKKRGILGGVAFLAGFIMLTMTRNHPGFAVAGIILFFLGAALGGGYKRYGAWGFSK